MTPSAGAGLAAPSPLGGDALLEVGNLRVLIADGSRQRPLVHGVSLAIARHQTVAVVGESGSGKSMTALATVRLTPPGTRLEADTLRLGHIDLTELSEAELAEIRGRRISIVFQNPMTALNPVLTLGRQVTQVLVRHRGLRGRAAREEAVELLDLVGVADPARRVREYPFQMSGGMLQRAMIAIALAARPDLLIADEPTTALDTTLQAEIMDLLRGRQHDLGMGMLLISHNLGVVAAAADEVYVMYAGGVVEHAAVATLFGSPAHPYTRALLGTVRDLAAPETRDLRPIPGVPPRLDDLPPGCPFAPRCPLVIDRCRREVPALRPIRPGQEAACHLAQS